MWISSQSLLTPRTWILNWIKQYQLIYILGFVFCMKGCRMGANHMWLWSISLPTCIVLLVSIMMHPQVPWWTHCNSKVKIIEGKVVGVCSLSHITLGVKGHVATLGWGLGKLISNSITHTDLHKPNNKLVSAYLKHFWCMDEPRVNTNSQDSSRPELGGSHHLPLYNIFCAWPHD
jgi:hypothetical protein